MSKERVSKFLFNMISKFSDYDCSFIKNTPEFSELESFFLLFFNDKDKNIIKLYDIIYVIDKYIVKIKKKYQPEYLVNAECIVKTYYKKNFVFKNHDISVELGIEIQDYIDSNEEITLEEVWNIYFQLREKGYIWLDAKPNNLIKKNNKTYIVDTDYIFKEEDKNINKIDIIPSEFSIQFNELYQEIH